MLSCFHCSEVKRRNTVRSQNTLLSQGELRRGPATSRDNNSSLPEATLGNDVTAEEGMSKEDLIALPQTELGTQSAAPPVFT